MCKERHLAYLAHYSCYQLSKIFSCYYFFFRGEVGEGGGRVLWGRWCSGNLYLWKFCLHVAVVGGGAMNVVNVITVLLVLILFLLLLLLL